MNQEHMTKMATAFLSELSEIEKQGFAPLRFLAGGVRRLGVGMANVGRQGGFLGAIGGAGARRAGGVSRHIKQIYRSGAKPVAVKGVEGGGNMFGGLKALARSPYGQMAAVPALAAGGLYAGKKLLG